MTVSPLLSDAPPSGEVYATRPSPTSELTWPPSATLKPAASRVEVAASTDWPATSGTVLSTPAISSPGGVWKSS